MSRAYTSDSIAGHAAIVQGRFFAVALALSLGWIGCAIAGEPYIATAIALVAAVFYGMSAGAWILAERLK